MQIVFDMNDLFKPHSRFIRHLNHYRYIIQIPNEISKSDFCFQKDIYNFQKEDFRICLFRCELTKVFRDLHGGFFLYPRKVAHV